VRYQNRAAEDLARAGYRIRRLPPDPNDSSPDFEIEGFIFDCFTPRPTTKPSGIRNALRAKIRKGQADRFVVNLDRSDLIAKNVRDYLERYPSARLKEVLIIKSGIVTRVWP
jgi:hypothetical protein